MKNREECLQGKWYREGAGLSMVLSPECLFGSSWNSWTSEFHSQLIATLTDDFFLEMSFIS